MQTLIPRLGRRQFNGKVLAACVALLYAAAAPAHDFWIDPQTFRPAVGATVPLRLLVGQQYSGEPTLYVPEQFERYVYAGPTGEHPVAGKLGDDPAGAIPIKAAGLYTVGYFSTRFEVKFDTFEEFEKYLVMEGLERNLALARKRASLRGGVLETYRRCAKSLLQAGGETGKPDHAFGFPLELIAESNPHRGERRMSVRLLYRNKPLADALVVAFSKKNPLDKQKIRTDKEGRAVFELNQPGAWLITSVHMFPAGLLARADWESLWASLTFDVSP